MTRRSIHFSATTVLGLLALVGPARASLTTFASYTGNVGLSTDGWGSITQSGTIHAYVPAGSTVVAAYLYSGMNAISGPMIPGGALDGTAVPYGPVVVNISAPYLSMSRADVTNIVAPVVNAGGGAPMIDAATGAALQTYNFSITETSGGQDGEALVVVYNNPSLPQSSVGILDGFSALNGDNSSINFSQPLNPSAPGFFADMRIGDNFSCCGQASTISVNGTTITANAGNDDDKTDAFDANGNLITVGGNNDPYSPLLPTYAADHERYNLTPEISNGDTSINVHTFNQSQNDNIFLETFLVSGIAGFNAPPPPPPSVPEPTSIALMGTVVGGLALRFRRKRV